LTASPGVAPASRFACRAWNNLQIHASRPMSLLLSCTAPKPSLLVEDDAALRKAVCELLLRYGYSAWKLSHFPIVLGETRIAATEGWCIFGCYPRIGQPAGETVRSLRPTRARHRGPPTLLQCAECFRDTSSQVLASMRSLLNEVDAPASDRSGTRSSGCRT
jgi:hypothetical protein